MAKSKQVEETAMTAAPSQALANRQSFIEKGDITGTEGIGVNDLRLPRLAIAQGLSSQLIEGDSSYIKDLKMFDLFNDLTGTVYGKGPLTFIVCRRDVRYIEFEDRDKGGGILDINVTADGEAQRKDLNPDYVSRLEWTVGPNGERIPPRATKFVEFIILLLMEDRLEPIVLSIKDTNKFNRRASEKLTGLIKLRQKPIYAGLYTIASKTEKNDNGTFGVPVIQDAGILDNPNVSDDDWERNRSLYEYAKNFAASLAGKQIHVNREPGDEAGTDDFPPVVDRPAM